ncbi:MAG TPA: RNA polymerase factor sigma-54 [Chlamydiales bacterium]|nr:RNA polymerase factor sigma-54 [Chlamydiales bacterium]
MDPRLALKLAPERRLVMTYALRQALEILQMPQMELGQWLLSEIEKNPLLELAEPCSKPRFDAEIPAPITLHEHLMSQIRENFPSPRERLLAEEFVEHLDERGFITGSLDTMDGERILSVLQTFDPPGIFARNLQEAFLIQLRRQGKGDSLCYQLVQNCFEDLLHGRYVAIKKKLGSEELGFAMQTLARLSRRPASVYQVEPVTPTVPDLKISKIEGGWTLELIEDDLPKFHMQDDYLSLELESDEERELLRGLKTQAKWIFRSLNRRRKLLRAIGGLLLRKQASYLDQKGPLGTLSIRELSEKLQIHESTLSRALHGKYVSTPRGVIPLRSLISSSPVTNSARELLEQLINGEDKGNPLTDDQLARELKTKGFSVARRTIAKYRSQLKIGSATQRKHLTKQRS